MKTFELTLLVDDKQEPTGMRKTFQGTEAEIELALFKWLAQAEENLGEIFDYRLVT